MGGEDREHRPSASVADSQHRKQGTTGGQEHSRDQGHDRPHPAFHLAVANRRHPGLPSGSEESTDQSDSDQKSDPVQDRGQLVRARGRVPTATTASWKPAMAG